MFSAKRGASCVRNKIFSFGYRNDAPIRQRRKPAAAAAREVIEREVGAGWGRHQTQQVGAAAAGNARLGREAPSAIGGEGGSKKCGWDAVEGWAEAGKERMWMDVVREGNRVRRSWE
jgi:hypothetical protein